MQFLRVDLAELFLKLKQYAQAEKTLNVVLEQDEPIDMDGIVQRMKFYVILSKVYQNSGDTEKALKTLGSSFGLQTK